MKSLNLLSFFKRPSVLAYAILIASVFVFSSNATADEKKFDVLSGVTAQVLTPPAMDAIQGTGSVHIGFHPDEKWNHWDWVDPKSNDGPFNVWVRLERLRGAQLTLTRD